MAKPDRIKKIQLFLLISMIPLCVLVMNTIPQDINRTTKVRMAVARVELTPSMPILARMEVNAANTDAARANKNHMYFPPNPVVSLT